MHAYEVASCSIIRLPEAESAPSPSVQAESTSGKSGQISFLIRNLIFCELIVRRCIIPLTVTT